MSADRSCRGLPGQFQTLLDEVSVQFGQQTALSDSLAAENATLREQLARAEESLSRAACPAAGRLRSAAGSGLESFSHLTFGATDVDLLPAPPGTVVAAPPAEEPATTQMSIAEVPTEFVVESPTQTDYSASVGSAIGKVLYGRPSRTRTGVGHSVWSDFGKAQEFKKAFRKLCHEDCRFITADDIYSMGIRQQGLESFAVEALDGSREVHVQKYKRAIQQFNKAMAQKIKHQDLPDGEAISVETYLLLIELDGNQMPEAIVGTEAAKTVREIRRILLQENTLRAVAFATHADTKDVNKIVKRQNFKFSRVMKYMDPVIGLLILLNALIIGLSLDVDSEWIGWEVIEILFTVVFTVEIAIKLYVNGVTESFTGQDWAWNWFDLIVVLFALVDLVFSLMGSLINLNKFTLMKLLRLARITKLVRVLKLNFFKELALFFNGCLCGLRTLFWAVVFLGFFIYILAVMIRTVIGDNSHEEILCDKYSTANCFRGQEHIHKYGDVLFGSVFKSMFTVFRCFTDGCSSVDGTPISVHFYDTYGPMAILVYVLCMMFVIFGLFNLIMAIFVENTITSAKRSDDRRREALQNEHIRLAQQLQAVVVKLCTAGQGELDNESEGAKGRNSWVRNVGNTFRKTFATSTAPKSLSENTEEMPQFSAKITHATFNDVIQKPEVQTMLDDLGISMFNRAKLFDVLDADANGYLDVHEITQGLLRLRGEQEKSDSVATLLCVKSIQKTIRTLESTSIQNKKVCDMIRLEQRSVQAKVESLAGEAGRPTNSARHIHHGQKQELGEWR